MNWTNIWLSLFGTTKWLGIDMGFWMSMLASALIVVGMNVVFWGMKPLKTRDATQKDTNVNLRI